MSSEWWRDAVIYQIYPRSFRDATGDGVGDLAGITAGLPDLAELGVDAVWLSPFYTSPQNDAGYDVADYTDVDPLFGHLGDIDQLLQHAHHLGLRVIVDLVPNHSSNDHPLFRAALAAAPGSPERAMYLFRDGAGEHGELPPNNWPSMFGGDAWSRVTEPDGTPGQWYLHLFDATQPDWDWTNPAVADFFDSVLRFWLDRGVDGFRVDVANSMAKAAGLPDGTDGDQQKQPWINQPGVHDIIRRWRRVLDSYEGERILAGEAWVTPLSALADWVRPDEMHQTFNFDYLQTPWDAAALKAVVDDSLSSFGSVGAPSTWVLSNHDVIRHATRLALAPEHQSGIEQGFADHPDEAAGLRRARAATAFMLGLPGSSYLYQGEELGLPEVIELPEESRQDPAFFRTGGQRLGRDGCRVPLPWAAATPGFGFSPDGASWLPQPSSWNAYARDAQTGVEGSTLEFYRATLAARRSHALGRGSLTWVEAPDAALSYRNGDVTVLANLGASPVPLPAGEVIVASGELQGGSLPGDTTVWVRA